MVHFLTSISTIRVSFNVLVNFINVIDFITRYSEVNFIQLYQSGNIDPSKSFQIFVRVLERSIMWLSYGAEL